MTLCTLMAVLMDSGEDVCALCGSAGRRSSRRLLEVRRRPVNSFESGTRFFNVKAVVQRQVILFVPIYRQHCLSIVF